MALTLEQVRAMLPCNKHRLDDELEIQPDIMERISSRVVVMNSRMLEAKDELARVEARLLEDVKDGESRVTKDQAEAKVKRDPERRKAWERFQAARAEFEEWQGALDAWRAKGFSLTQLCGLYASNYYSVDSVSPRARDRMGKDDERRTEMRKASHERQEESRAASTEEPSGRRRVLT